MPSELRPTKARKGPDDRLTRLKGKDPKPADPLPNMVTDEEMKPKRTVLEAAVEIFHDDLDDPDGWDKEIEAMHAAEATGNGTVVTAEGTVADANTGEVISPGPKKMWKPGNADFITLRGRGGTYLPARKRINWLRGGDPDAHPNWGIDTILVTHEIGKRSGPGKVEGGYAVVRAILFDELGRTIASGHKTEYSENFADYVEKAETGAIARALAVAGYGTESALDLDEGYDQDRPADGPVRGGDDGRPIVISGSDVKDVRQGGRQTVITQAQMAAIGKEVKRLGIGPAELASAYEVVVGELTDEGDSIQERVENALSALSFADAGKLIQALIAADPPKQKEASDDAEVPTDDEVLAASLIDEDIGAK